MNNDNRYFIGTSDGNDIVVVEETSVSKGITIRINYRSVIACTLVGVCVLTATLGPSAPPDPPVGAVPPMSASSSSNSPEPTETPAPQTDFSDYTDENGFVFFQSSYAAISMDDISYLKQSDHFRELLRMSVNEIYARHGYIFNPDGIYAAYYGQFGWYKGTKTEVYWDEFSDIEAENLKLLLSVEKENGFYNHS